MSGIVYETREIGDLTIASAFDGGYYYEAFVYPEDTELDIQQKLAASKEAVGHEAV